MQEDLERIKHAKEIERVYANMGRMGRRSLKRAFTRSQKKNSDSNLAPLESILSNIEERRINK